MSFDTSWDIEKYKSPFESEEHWELRRDFLLAHKEKYPEDQLICLAQVFFNVEFLGCRYPEETMNLVEELSEGIADSFREKKQSKLQRTFVKASDAAGAKIKGLSVAAASNSSDSQNHISPVTSNSIAQQEDNIPIISTSDVSSPIKESCTENQATSNTSTPDVQTPPHVPDSEAFQEKQSASNNNVPDTQPSSCTKVKNSSKNKKAKSSNNISDSENFVYNSKVFNVQEVLPNVKDLVIVKTPEENIIDHSAAILHRTLAQKRIVPQYDFIKRGKKPKHKWECNLIINNQKLAKSLANNKQVSKRAATKAVLLAMQKICYTLEEKVKYLTNGATIEKNLEEQQVAPSSSEDTVANKMMKLMGWKGGGLGKTEQGISEPIAAQEVRIHRAGFGADLSKAEIIKQIGQKIQSYAETENDYDLLFSNDFSKEERSELHVIANRFDLKSRSYGSGAERRLVVSKKNRCKNVVIEKLKNCGGENERYRLVAPKDSEQTTTDTK